jgi:phosphatidylserine synthase
MKVNYVYGVIAVGICALLSYAVYTISKSMDRNVLTLCSFVAMIIPLFCAMGLKVEETERTNINLKVLATVFFVLTLICNMIFAFCISFSMPLYIILNGLLVLIFVLIYYSIYRVKQ